MTTAGWIFMLLSWGFIISLVTFCYVRTLSSNSKKKDQVDEHYKQ